MIKHYARKPVRDFLNVVTEPPYSLPTDKHNKFFESILEVYEESTNKERQDFLCTDTFDLLRAFVDEDRAINRKDPKDTHRLSMIEIRLMLWGLIAAAKQWGVRLPDSEIKRYEKVDFINGSFAQFVRDTYNPPQPFDYLKSKKPKPAPATDGSNIQNQPATSTGDTPPPPEIDDYPMNIFNACIVDEYRPYAKTIREELQAVVKDRQAAYIVKTFATCCIEPHAILKKCPSYKEAQMINDVTLGTSQGYDTRKREVFDIDINGIYTTPKETFWQNDSTLILQIVQQLKPMFSKLGITIKGI